MVFVVEQENTVNVGGKEETKTERIPLGVDPIREENGKWYILLPGVKDKE